MPDARISLEVFYAYAPQDEPYCQELDKHLSILKRQGLISTWHSRLILAGANWSQDTDAHLNQAAVILLLISADFLASDYCYNIELQQALERHQAGEVRVIPILLRSVDWKGASFAHLQPLPIDGRFITQWEDLDTAFTEVAAGIRRAIEDQAQLTIRLPNSAFPPFWNIPLARNPFFLDREDLLTQLHMQLQGNQSATFSQKQALSGLGGIGKTQLAVEYAYRYCESYRAVLWVRADTPDTLNASYSELAVLLNLPEQQAQEQGVIVQAVKHWFQTQKGWLLILDSADEPEVLAPFLPQTMGGQLVLTTRASALRRFGIASPLRVETFVPERGALLLLRRAGLLAPDATLEQATALDQTLALQLTQEFDGLPLALDQAGAYLEATGTSLASYQQIYHQHRLELLQDRRGTVQDHPEPVATTWSLSMKRVEEKSPAAADLLRFCAFLASNAIGEEIVREGGTHLGPILAPAVADTYLLDQAVETLRAYSLIERDPVATTLVMHRLVQEVVRIALPSEMQYQWMQRVILAVNAAFPLVKVEKWPACERLLPHALLCAKWIAQSHIASQSAAHLLNQTAVYLQERSRYAEAEALFQNALAISQQVLGSEHPDTANHLNNLATAYQMQGKYTEAEPLYVRALVLRDRVLGSEHPDTAQNLSNLSLLYNKQGRYQEAERLGKQALMIRERVLGPEHPDTATSLNNLALLYKDQGRYEEAEQLYEQGLVICEKVLGPEHPDTVISLNNLVALYKSQGKYTQAEPLALRARMICEKVLGLDHPYTAASLNNLAELYNRQGNYGNAEPLYRRALEIRKQILGVKHPDLAISLNNLALFYKDQKKYAEAEPLLLEALTICEEMLGAEHPDTASSINSLAALYDSQGKYAEAEPLYKRALIVCERVSGVDHPDTAGALHNLAFLYSHQKKYTEAELLYQRALLISEKVWEPNHPSIAFSLNNLALLYSHQKKYAEAELLYQRVLAIQNQRLEDEHPYTATVLNDLAAVYEKQGNYMKAEPLYERALMIQEKLLGDNHFDTVISLNNLAVLYKKQGKCKDAESLYKRALAIAEKLLGDKHSTTLTIRANYAQFLQQREH